MCHIRSMFLLGSLIAVPLILLGAGGCDDDESPAASAPVTGVDILPESMQVEISRTVEVAATVSGGQSRALRWYVGGVLGGGARGGTGGNIIRNNSECGIWNESTHAIYAIGNVWGNDPPVEGEDYCNQFGGTVVWQE